MVPLADILFDGLPVLDLLEITPSTSVVAQITQRDQSSISRIYRQVSRRLGLDFRKQNDGRYRASANQVLLEGLRRSSQWMRLQAAPAAPRWLACGHAAEVTGAQQPTLMQHCGDPMQVERLLQERVLDLAVITRPSHAAPAAAADLLELPVLRHPGGIDLILMRRDLSDHQALQALIAAVQQQVRQHLRQHPEQEWLG
ncbi:MAG: hypothetical protein FJ076_04865 [Cyanobacteria bacterium K_DeepCast_35m_m1_288]|jgi:hypothetical protein|nr:hypothetical protein [Cyanobacteria bacterium K_DeepCast_35m_m1_288]